MSKLLTRDRQKFHG